MDNLITGAFAVTILIAFIVGLANSINALPFWVIVLFVSLLALIDFKQSIKKGLKEDDQDHEHLA